LTIEFQVGDPFTFIATNLWKCQFYPFVILLFTLSCFTSTFNLFRFGISSPPCYNSDFRYVIFPEFILENVHNSSVWLKFPKKSIFHFSGMYCFVNLIINFLKTKLVSYNILCYCQFYSLEILWVILLFCAIYSSKNKSNEIGWYQNDGKVKRSTNHLVSDCYIVIPKHATKQDLD
jgi:hypothetical protein